MRSPGSAQLALDDAGTMVNCTVKSEGKKEPCHEAPQGSATAAEPQPGDPARVPQDGADPQAPAQVPSTLLGAPGSVSPPRFCSPMHVAIPRVGGTGIHQPSWAEGLAEMFFSGQDLDGWVGQATCLSRILPSFI